MNSIILTFSKFKQTTRTWRYLEDNDPADAIVGTLYLKKTVVEELGDPQTIKVTVEKA